MKNYLQKAQNYVKRNSELVIGVCVVAGLFAIVGIVALVNHLSGPVIVYQPVRSCDLLTVDEARTFLGDDVMNTESDKPTVKDDLATSHCGYSDTNADAMRVAAVAVRSGINDEGVAFNKTEFAKAAANNQAEAVADLGDSAFFNKVNGQLNVLDGKQWIIINYGLGSAPQDNTLEQALEIAKKVIP